MAVIVNAIPKDANDVWQVARWAFVWLLRQAIASCSDVSTRTVFERAIALDGIHLHLLEHDEAERARQILIGVATRGAAGELPRVEVEGRILDEPSQVQFRLAAAELVRLLTNDGARASAPGVAT